MSILCKLGLHAWTGCICNRCHKCRDKEHQWEGCKCSKCGTIRDYAHDYGTTHWCKVCHKSRFFPPENNAQAMKNISEIEQGADATEVAAVFGRLMRVATEYWKSQTASFQIKLMENEIKIALGLLGGKYLEVPSKYCGKTTGIGLAALTRYILLKDTKQIWIVSKGALHPLVYGKRHAVLREFLGLFGVELLDARWIMEYKNEYLVFAHKYGNMIPVFEGRDSFSDFTFVGYEISEYWNTINVVYLDNICPPSHFLQNFPQRCCSIVAVAEKCNINEEFFGPFIFTGMKWKWEKAF